VTPLKKKILLVSHSSEPSGAPRVLLDVAESLSQERYELILCFPEQKGMATIAQDKGFHVLIVENPQTGLREQKGLFPKIRLLLLRIKFMISFRREVKQGKYDLVYLNSSASIYAGCALFGLKTRILWHIHEDLCPTTYNRFRRWAICRSAGYILFVSPSNLEFFKPLPASVPFEILPNGIRMEQMEHFPVDEEYRKRFSYTRGETIVATVSFFSPIKGIDIFLKAMALVVREYGTVKSVIAGVPSRTSGDYWMEIQRLSNLPELKGLVFFPGYCENMPSFLECVAIFVLASRNDAMPLAVLEAMAAGKPVIATDVGCLREMLDPPSAGMVVPREDPENLAREIIHLLKNPQLQEKMAIAAKERIQDHYSFESFRKRTAGIIERILKTE